MTQLIAIVGMGEGNGMAIARRFAREGFAVAMMARNPAKLQSYQAALQDEGITAHYFVADAGDKASLEEAFAAIEAQLGSPDVLVYNAAIPRMQNVLETSFDNLVSDFQANVAGALVATQAVLSGMQTDQKTGTILFTGGGFALYPHPDFASLSIGKAGIRSLAYILGAALEPQGIKVGTITISGTVDESDAKYNPTAIAEQYWTFHAMPQSEVEVVY
ncbi:SDR family NAD(P)-dependent oxidoreductase [Egbenema bharatensis]|uniref:SDR family NAD(P)-dependent oxidoreductase n=1 Tax=Egbenema bharatensis TaxID=3463334 RepID=UPI003A8B0790